MGGGLPLGHYGKNTLASFTENTSRRLHFIWHMQSEKGGKDFCELGDNNSKSSQVSTTHIAKADTHTI